MPPAPPSNLRKAIHFVLGGTGLMAGGSCVGEVGPGEAWQILEREGSARLVDVRTRAEWHFVGLPDTGELGKAPILVEWSSYPDMSVNRAFADEIEKAVGSDAVGPLLFLCRSGARSLQAAAMVADHYSRQGRPVTCLNVAEGFEGDMDASGRRGRRNGWKARGLAWRQS